MRLLTSLDEDLHVVYCDVVWFLCGYRGEWMVVACIANCDIEIGML